MTLFNLPSRKKRITGRIKKKLTTGWYLMEDKQSRQYRVAGNGYKVGQTVATVEGQIVDTAGSESTPQVHQV